jgi:hypothetical protein
MTDTQENDYQENYYYVKLTKEGQVQSVGVYEGNCIEVPLTPEEHLVLEYMDGKFFRIIDKIATAAYQLSKKTPEDYIRDMAHVYFRPLYRTCSEDHKQNLINWLAISIERLELKVHECILINEHFDTGDNLMQEFINSQPKAIDEDSFFYWFEKWFKENNNEKREE